MLGALLLYLRKRVFSQSINWERNCDSIPCISHNIFFLKPLLDLLYENENLVTVSKSSRYVKKDLLYFFNYLDKNFLYYFKNLLIHPFLLEECELFLFVICCEHIFDLKVPKISLYLTHFLNHVSVSLEL